jgi:hypothetical protein
VISYRINLVKVLVYIQSNLKLRFLRFTAMTADLVHVGFGNILAMSRVIAIASPNSAPTKRTIQEARGKGLLIDMTNGRRTKAVIFADSGHIVLAALAPETITGRLTLSRGGSLLRPEQIDEKIRL